MTSPVDTSVKYFHSDMTDAPIISGAIGSMIAVLDACLVNGFGLKTATSLVVSGGIATMTVSGAHPVEVDTVVLIEGATPIALNGEQKVKTVSGGVITFATAVSDQTATGTITMKLAPAGFEKKYSGTNKAAYKSLDVTSTGFLLRVDDTNTKFARLVGYEAMGGIDSGTNPFPTNAQISGGGYWSKSNSTDSTARRWTLITNGKCFYLSVLSHTNTSYSQQLHFFGDVVSTKVSGDAFACILHATTTDCSGNSGLTQDANLLYSTRSTVSTNCFIARVHTGLGGSSAINRAMSSPVAYGDGLLSGAITDFPYPNAPNGGLYLTPLNLVNVSLKVFRAKVSGGYAIPHLLPVYSFAMRDKISNVAGLSNKNLMFLGGTDASYIEGIFIDLTGPWV